MRRLPVFARNPLTAFPVAALALCLAFPAVADEAGQITVTGEGRVEAAPDMATITVGVSTSADTAGAALSTNSKAVAAVLAQLQDAGIAPRDMQTSGLSLGPQYDHSASSGQAAITGYAASNIVTVRVRALERLGGVLDDLVGAGANQFHGLGFGLQDPQPAADEARRRAVGEARRKAQLYAEAAGVTLGRVISITEQTVHDGPGPVLMRSAAAESAVPIAEGELAMTAQVNVVYELAK